MAKDFIDWCTHVLTAIIEEGNKSPHTRTDGLDEVRLFHILFSDDAPYYDSNELKSMRAALDSLENMGLVEGHGGHFWKVTFKGRQHAPDMRPLWKDICGTTLQSDHQQILSVVNKLSPRNIDDIAWLEDIHHKELLPALGEKEDAELGESDAMDTLWTLSEDLAHLGFVERDARSGPHLILTATYRGLVWETRRRLFQKCDVFISHITAERELAQKLKDFLIDAFGSDFKAFVSSDYRSIGGGKVWYSEIIESLKAAPVILVLLSETSVERRWINFEAGVGIGSDSLVIPLVTTGFPKDKVGMPLSQLQVRSLYDEKDVEGMIEDIAQSTKASFTRVPTSSRSA